MTFFSHLNLNFYLHNWIIVCPRLDALSRRAPPALPSARASEIKDHRLKIRPSIQKKNIFRNHKVSVLKSEDIYSEIKAASTKIQLIN